MKRHFSDTHDRFASSLDSQTREILKSAAMKKGDDGKYYVPIKNDPNCDGERLTHCKLPDNVRNVAEMTIKAHADVMEMKLQRKLIEGLKARSATVATISDCKEITGAKITEKALC